ncbi:MAG: ABC transporter substrate-binding protein [Bacteroidetes bacterium]|nr:ABC transporter substrate-binding protein [Bacteroidota bacterium]
MNKKVVYGIVAVILIILVGFGIYRQVNTGQANEVVKIGAILPLTGGTATVPANDARNGMLLAIEYINENGGLNGKKVELVVQDSKNDNKTGLDAYKYIATTGTIRYFITQISGVTMAIKNESNLKKQYLISMIGAIHFKDDCETCIRNYIEPDKIGKEITVIIADTLKLKTFAVIYPETEYGKSIFSSVEQESKLKGATISSNVSYDEKTIDFKNIVSKLLSNRSFEGVYITGLGKNIGQLIKAFKESGYKGQIVCDHSSSMSDVKQIAGNLMKGIYYFSFPDINEDFNRVFKNRFGYEPSFYSGLAYNSIKFILKNEKSDLKLPLMYDTLNIAGQEFLYNFKIKRY